MNFQKRCFLFLMLTVLCLATSVPASNQYFSVYNEYGWYALSVNSLYDRALLS
ncbi:MAG: hypothetical protein LBT05_08345 [Planctomycetaceae bacterium]|nr:hypothetical protein [Planctomycetaceae bacterium]